MHFHDVYPARGIIKSKENTRYWMHSQNPRNKNNFFRYLPFQHLKCWKVNVYWDKRQVSFHIKMTCEQCIWEECAVWKSLGQTKHPCSHISFSIISSSHWKGTPFATGSTGIFFSSEVHFWNDSRFNFYKVMGPQTLTNELHYTQGSRYLLWQSVSLEEWYLHMREKKKKQNQDSYLVFWFLLH